jgi:AhpD family alkylhydroperoxidase
VERLQFWRFDNDGIRALMRLPAHIAQSGLESSLLDLVYLRVSQLNGCSPCVDAHARDAITHGLDQRLVDDIVVWRESSLFTERQRAALAWTDAVTEIAKTGAPDDVYREAADRFSETELVDLTLAIALMNAFARIAVAFRHGPPPMPAVSEGAATSSGG